MKTRLSTKGQLVLPGEVRRRLALRPGTEFIVEIHEHNIVLIPSQDQEGWRKLRGCLRNVPLIDELEAEHRRELRAEP